MFARLPAATAWRCTARVISRPRAVMMAESVTIVPTGPPCSQSTDADAKLWRAILQEQCRFVPAVRNPAESSIRADGRVDPRREGGLSLYSVSKCGVGGGRSGDIDRRAADTGAAARSVASQAHAEPRSRGGMDCRVSSMRILAHRFIVKT